MRVLAGLCVLLIAVTAWSAEPQLRIPSIDRVAIPEEDRERLTVARPSPDRIVSISPEVSQLRLNEAAVDAGRVVAIVGDRVEAVSAASLADQVRDRAVIVEAVGNLQAAAPPTVLTDSQTAGRQSYKLGYRINAWSADEEPLKLEVWARDSTGLAVDGPNTYSGEFNIALTSMDAPEMRKRLLQPVNVAVNAVGATRIDPKPVQIQELAQWVDVSISVPDVEGESYAVNVSADPRGDGNQVDLAVITPRISLLSTPSTIVGYGIGLATISVEAAGMRNAEGYRVRLHSTAGSLERGVVALDASGYGAVDLRSSSAEGTEVIVRNEGVVADTLKVGFDAPWLFLCLAIAGGLAGAFLRGKGRHHWVKALSIGVVSAVVMTLAYAVGIDWFARALDWASITWGGEAQVFVLGAVAALIGVSVLVPGVDGDSS